MLAVILVTWLLVCVSCVQKTGFRALHLAALKGSQPVVQALLLGGADVDVRAKVGTGGVCDPHLLPVLAGGLTTKLTNIQFGSEPRRLPCVALFP